MPMSLTEGAAIGPYRIIAPLAAGGMGEVYRARDPRLGREVAVKLLLTSESPEGEHLRRFEREAKATAALNHPNIVTVYDVGVHEGRPFLVTELLEGQTLRERIESGPLEVDQAVGFARQLVRGVIAAHALKIIHRDLKPANIFLCRDQNLKILDFGLAKLVPESSISDDLTTLDASTPGVIVGTLAYMAPEQVRGEPLDPRADLFAIGIVLFELLTGQSPFRRSSGPETLAAVLHEEPKPAIRDTGLSKPLTRLISHCLEKDPAERFQTARDLAFALESVEQDKALLSSARPRTVSEPAPSIAVLPFADMSSRRDQDYLCEGIAEELINSLTHIEGLRIAARSSSFQFKGSGVDIRAVGERLGVATVLEGSVRKIGERIRVGVQLVNVADGYHLWSERYDRKLEDVFAIEDEIAECVATALRGVLSPQEREALRRPETAPETYEYFLRGRKLLNQFERTALELAGRMFERAIELDPNYAPAWAGLADAHTWMYQWWGGDEEDLEAADRASSHALELNPDLSDARASRGFVLASRGHYDAAYKEFDEAMRLNPNSFFSFYYHARTRFAAGEIERSADLFRKASEVRLEDFQSVILLGQSLEMLGRREAAVAAFREGVQRAERRLEFEPDDVRALALGAQAVSRLGEHDRALRWSNRALGLHPSDQSVLTNAACLRAKLGMKEEALELLELAFSKGFGKRDWIANDPDYDSLRDEPRFQALLEKLR